VTIAEELEREALRLYRRYAVEVVEQFGLCPWAEHARREGHVEERVILQENWEKPELSLHAIKAAERAQHIEIVLLIYPDLEVGRLAFENLVRRIRDCDTEAREVGTVPFAMAAFHPDASPDTSEPERFIPFLRRTPDPTIQLVRRSTLERVRGKRPEGTAFMDVTLFDPSMLVREQPLSLRERIARTNLETAQTVGVSALAQVIDSIREDRQRTYARVKNNPALGNTT
jgi:hypothetical protein